jgi:ATP-dependent Lon protease
VSEPKEKEAAGDLEAACAELPIFPLPQVVLFPRALLPLHIFEPRYRAMLKDCLASHRAMAMALIHEPLESRRGGIDRPAIATVCGAGIIVEHQELPDGRSNILLHGRARVRIEELPFVPPYRRAKATILHDVPTHVPETDRAALFAAATAFVQEIAKKSPRVSFSIPRSLEPGAVADLCAHHLVVDAKERQAILEELDQRERVRMVIAALANQHSGLLRGQEGPSGLN